MPIDVRIVSSDGKRKATVSPAGQLVTGRSDFSRPSFQNMNVDNTAFNFWEPIPHQQFVITGIRFKADQNVATNTNAEVIIYEASSLTSLTVDEVLYEDLIVRGQFSDFLPVELLVAEGKFVNGKTSDNTIPTNVVGYYIPALVL